MGSPPAIDVLVLTAAEGEDVALRAVDEGAVGAWEDLSLDGLPGRYAVRAFEAAGSRQLRVAHAHAQRMGETNAAAVAVAFVQALKPKILAMCGVCAGRPKWTNLGDVVIADVLYKYDAGEVVAGQGCKPAHFKADGAHRDLPASWRAHAQAFGKEYAASAAGKRVLPQRPWPLEVAELWLLQQLDAGVDPSFGAPIHLEPGAWRAMVEQLRRAGQVELVAGKLTLTTAARDRLADERLLCAGDIKPPEWRLHVAPFGTGSKLVRDQSIWDDLAIQARHVRALDMEGAAVGEVGWLLDIQPTLVVKGVMDFAELGRTQFMRAFAAKAAAEVLLALLRAHADPSSRGASDVLQSGIAERPAAAINPGSLLHPRYQVVPFLDAVRARELAEMQRWCDDPKPLAARLLYGPGGAGKTRLLQEWAARLRGRGWSAGFLPDPVSEADLDLVLAAATPTLVVIDYAEARADLLDLMKRVAQRRGKTRLRVVLLAREVADWWKRLLHSDEAVAGLLRAHEPMVITEVPVEGDARAIVFHAASAAFAPILGASADVAVPDLADPVYSRTLYLAMAALAALEGEPIRADSILSDTVARERRFWLHRFVGEIGKSSEANAEFVDGVSRLMAAATLRGGVDYGAAAEGLQQRTRAPQAAHLLRWLASAYPGHQRAGIAPVEPDLLGEQLVIEALQHPDTPPTFLEAVFQDADRAAYTAGFLVLGRLGARADGAAAHEWIERLIGDASDDRALAALVAVLTLRSETAFAPIGPLLASRLDATHGSVEIARAIEGALDGSEPSLTMRELRAWATQRQLAALKGAIDADEERSRLFANLGAQMSRLGQREAALEAAQEAVAIRRRLAQSRPEEFLPDVAMSLSNLGVLLSDLCQHQAALEVAREAVAIFREMAPARREVFLPNLATSLNNLSALLSDLGQREAALEAMEEAAAIHRRLAQLRPEVFLSNLATSLNNLSARLSDLGQCEAALEATREATAIYRRLASARPDAFLPGVAMSLNNFGNWLSKLGQGEAALEAAQEAAAIYRRLARSRPEEFLPDLAMSLNNLGARLRELGQREEGLEATRETAEIYRRLALSRPEVFLPDLAASLNNFGSCLGDLGQREAALEAGREAMVIYRRMAQSRPETFLPDLAMSLNNLGVHLSKLGQREAALEATREAAAIYRRLASARPEAFLPDLAKSLKMLGFRLRDLCQHQAALEVTREAVAIYRQLAPARPEAFLSDMAMSLNNLGVQLSELGQREAALEAVQEAVALCRQPAQLRPEAFLPDLAMSLNNLGVQLGELGQREAALEAAREAVAIYRQLAPARREAFVSDLAKGLNNLGNWLSDLGQREAALEAVREAVAIYRQLASARPEAFLPDLAASLNNFGACLSDLGQREAALEATQEAVGLSIHLTEARPAVFKALLIGRLRNLVARLGDAQQPVETNATARAAVHLLVRLRAL